MMASLAHCLLFLLYFLRGLSLNGGRLLITGYTQQDGGYSVTRGRTGRVIMLHLPAIFKDSFE